MSEKPYGLAVRAVILDDQGRCLLLRRSGLSKHFAEKWEWPGGKVDEGEAFDEALRREVLEETGLEVSLAGVVGAAGFEMEHVQVAMLCLEAKLTGGTLLISEEHDQHAWVNIVEVPQWDLTEVMKELAEALAEKHRP
jgi:8-oxo-dGTP diphosphatase